MMRQKGKTIFSSLAIVLFCSIFCLAKNKDIERREGDRTDPAINPVYQYYKWPDSPPEKCLFEQSKEIKRIVFTGRYANYTGADTWYLQWAPDGNQYSCWTDGTIDGYYCSSGRISTTGQAKIVGHDPLNLKFINLGKVYSGKNYYPCVSLIADGVFYIGTYSAFNHTGYFNGFRYSKGWEHFVDEERQGWKSDFWTNAAETSDNFFNEKNKARFRVLHAVVFGQNNQLSPDSKTYFSAHGYSGGNGQNNWDKGDAIYLCRVDSEIVKVIDPNAYEFFAGYDSKNNPLWSKDIKQSKPILNWQNHLGSESIAYIKGINKYILLTCRTKEREKNLPYDVFIIWESSKITGPYRMVHYLRDWGPQTYFANIPAKFISKDGKRFWLCVACNYNSNKYNPHQCRYAASLHEIVLDMADEPLPKPPVLGENIARQAKVYTPAVEPAGPPEGAIDGVVKGAPESGQNEWICRQEKNAYIKLSWEKPRIIYKVRLYDRPIETCWIKEGVLSFSDGSVEYLYARPSNKAIKPAEINFSPKTVSWVKFTITKGRTTKTETDNMLGLAEFEVYELSKEPIEDF